VVITVKPPHYERREYPPLLESLEILIAVLILAVGWFAWYVARNRYHYTTPQIEEIALYMVIGAVGTGTGIWLLGTGRSRREKQWPSPPLVISPKRDEALSRKAWAHDAVVLGYDVHGEPWFWPDKVRVMQGIVLGMTGSGKTTLLRNIISQDLVRTVGPPEDPCHIPMVIFDGKGDLEFFYDLLPHIHRAGRLHQLRVLNPARPDVSVLYNPFHCADDDYMPVVNMVFGSFNLHDEFFAKHQLNYLRLPGRHTKIAGQPFASA
jgi:hypothetical protein